MIQQLMCSLIFPVLRHAFSLLIFAVFYLEKGVAHADLVDHGYFMARMAEWSSISFGFPLG